jgi:hypothetical protein
VNILLFVAGFFAGLLSDRLRARFTRGYTSRRLALSLKQELAACEFHEPSGMFAGRYRTHCPKTL